MNVIRRKSHQKQIHLHNDDELCRIGLVFTHIVDTRLMVGPTQADGQWFLLLILVKSSQVVGLRTRVASIRTLIFSTGSLK